MKPNQDPSDLFEELAAIEHAYSGTQAKVEENDLIGAVFATAPEKYHTVLTLTAATHGKGLEMDHLEVAMYKLWRQGGGKPSGGTVPETEIVLANFAGQCYVCQKSGHKAYACPQKKNNSAGNKNYGNAKSNKGKFAGTCNLCGRRGHKKADCWDLAGNEDKRPASYKSRVEQANVHIDSQENGDNIEYVMCTLGDTVTSQKNTKPYHNDELYSYCQEDYADLYGDVILTELQTTLEYEDVPDTVIMPENFGNELALMGMVFPDNAQMLNDPNVWIGDTAATVHTTPHKIGIVANDNQSSEQVITVGNGTSKRTSMFGSLKGMIYNKE